MNDFLIPNTIMISRFVQLFDATDGLTPETGLTITDLDLTYCRDNKLPAAKVDAIELANIDSINDGAGGKMKEVDATSMPGVYRVDWPNEAFFLESWITGPPAKYPRQVVLCIKGAAIKTHVEIIHLYMPPGLIARYTDGIITDAPSADLYVGSTHLEQGAGALYAEGQLVTIRTYRRPQQAEVHHCVYGEIIDEDQGLLHLDRNVEQDDLENSLGEVDILAVPDGYFNGQNPLLVYSGTVKTVVSQTEFTLSLSREGKGASLTDDSYNGYTVILKDQESSFPSSSRYSRLPSVRICTDHTVDTEATPDVVTIKINRAAHFTLAGGDNVSIHANLGATAEIQIQGIAVATTGIANPFTTTSMITDLDESSNDHFKGRKVLWTSGVLRGQSQTITGYTGSSRNLVFEQATEACGEGDSFVITD